MIALHALLISTRLLPQGQQGSAQTIVLNINNSNRAKQQTALINLFEFLLLFKQLTHRIKSSQFFLSRSHFSSQVRIIYLGLNSSDIEVTVSGLEPSDFRVYAPSIESSVTSILEFQLQFQLSLDQLKTISIIFSPQTATSVSSNYTTPHVFTSESQESISFLYVRSEAAAALEVAPVLFSSLCIVGVLSLAILQCFFQISSQIFWAMINFDQMIFFAPFMALRLPSSVFFIFQTLSFAIGDLYFLVYAFNETLGKFFQNSNDASFSQNISKMGFSTYSIINASGPFIVIFLLQLSLLPLYFLINSMLGKSKRLKFNKYCGWIKWGLFIRSIIQASLQLILFASLNIGFFSQSPLTISSVISGAVSIFSCFCLIIFPFGILRILSRPSVELRSKGSKTYRRFGEFFRQLQYEKGFFSLHYFFWYFLRRYLFTFTLIFFNHSGKLQVTIAVVLSLIEVLYLTRAQPFIDAADNRISLLNEVCLLLIYLLLASLELVNSYTQTIIVQIITAIIIFVNIFDFSLLLILKCTEARKKCHRRKMLKMELENNKKRIRKRFNQSQAKEHSNLSLFYPVRRLNDNRESGASTESKFMCGIQRRENKLSNNPIRRIQIEGGPEYRLNDDSKTVQVFFRKEAS